MPLYEFECIPCRRGIEYSLRQLEKKVTIKVVADLVKMYKNIHRIEVVDLENRKLLANYGKKNNKGIVMDFYINDGSTAIIIGAEKYRFSELIYDEDNEKKLKCPFCKTRKVEKVFSSFAFTTDLSTDMPKPDLSALPPEERQKTYIGDFIEEKDRPKAHR